MSNPLKLIFTVPAFFLCANSFSGEFADMYTRGKLASVDKQRGLKFPMQESIKACSKMPQGLVADWGESSIMYRANIKGHSGVLVADSFLPDSKVDELEKKYKKGCVFKTSVAGEDIFINIIGEGGGRMVSWSNKRPVEICGNVTLPKLTEAQKQKTLANLKDDLRKSVLSMVEKFKEESADRKDNLVNKSVATATRNRYTEAWAGCIASLRDMGEENTNDLEKLIVGVEKEYNFKNSSTTFADTNAAIGGKLIGDLNLTMPYEKRLAACVDNLPLNKNINTVGDNIVFRGVEKQGEQKFYYKSSDGKFYSISKALLNRPGACQETQGSGINSCEYHNEVNLPSGERVGIDCLITNVRQPDGSYKQVEQVNFTNYLASNLSYTKIPIEEAEPKVAVSAMVGSVQQALSNYPNDFTYHGANKISDETKELFKRTFAECRDFLNEIAPSEKKWNEFAFQFSQGGKVSERGVASENERQSSGTSK